MARTPTRLETQLGATLNASGNAAISAATGVADQAATQRATQLLLPVVLDHLDDYSETVRGAVALHRLVQRLDVDPMGRAEAVEATNSIFGDRVERLVDELPTRTGLNEADTLATIRATTAWTLHSVGRMADDRADPHAINRVLELHDTPASARVSAVENAAPKAAAAAAAPSITTDANASDSGPKLPLGKIAAAVAGLAVVGGLLAIALGGGGSDDPVAETAVAASEVADPAPAEAEPAAPAETPTPAPEPESEPAAQPASSESEAEPESAPEAEPISASAAASDPTLTRLTVPMRDIKGTTPDASGSIDFTFNTLSGEICFTVGSLGVNPPYASHIHAGDFGVKGGVVADLGMLENNSAGCIDNLPADTAAILAAPSRHYAELHDAGGEWTVRGQLSETVDRPGIVPMTIPMRDILGTSPNASGVLSFDFNTLTGEVCYSVFSVGVEPPYSAHIHAGPFGIKGGVVLDMGGLETGSTGCVENELTDTLDILANPSGHYAEIHDAGGEWTVRGQLNETVDNPGIVTLAVPMTDIFDVEPSAEGTLHFAFNTVTGEICYDVTAANITPPFNSHIHAGDFGVKGGVVLDLGGLESGSAGCVNNPIGDTLAILADPSGHYAELHDAGGEWTVRGQLSEARAAVDPNATNLLLVDTDGGGASLRLEGGVIYLDGNVASQDVADELLASLAGVTTPVTNNLQIVEGAPVPSGRVVFGDNVFFESGSDRISDLPAGTVRAIVELAESRPDWVISIVGHTDNIGSDVQNLELSLRRAEAIRGLLITQGMNGNAMRIRGAGETAPIASNDTEAGRAQNRRIEFEFSPA